MSSLFLKIIAIITMTIDHSGWVLFDNNPILRAIGRMAFPLYGFMLVEGFNHTKNDKKRFFKYLISIFVLGLISEIIYDKLFHDSLFFLENQNILFTLSVSLICMYIYENHSDTIIDKISSIIIVIFIGLLSTVLFLDYSFLGIMLIFGYYLASKSNRQKLLLIIIILIYDLLGILMYGFNIGRIGILFSIIPILLYNGKKGYSSKKIQYFFYVFYPLHLLVLLIIKLILNN